MEYFHCPALVSCLAMVSPFVHTCLLTEYENWKKKVLDFIATTENLSVTNILLVLNPKHSRATGRKITSIPAEARTVVQTCI